MNPSHRLLLALLILPTIALAQNRCVENGRVLITDQACPGQQPVQATLEPALVAAMSYSNAYGPWRGKVQFQHSINGQVVNEAHSVVPMLLEIDPQGKVSGISQEVGCVAKGIATQQFGPTAATLDVTLTGCKYPSYNRRMSGHLIVNQAQKFAQLTLTGQDILRPQNGFIEIKGSLRR